MKHRDERLLGAGGDVKASSETRVLLGPWGFLSAVDPDSEIPRLIASLFTFIYM